MAEQTKQNTSDKKNGSRAWLITIICIASGAAFGCCYQKGGPVMPMLQGFFGISLSQGGLITSVCALMAVIFAIPAGGIVMKFGPKKVGIAALAAGLVGSLLGLLCNSFGLLLATRVIEGLGFAMVAVVFPTIISAWFTRKKRGLPMGIWGAWMGFGVLYMLLMSNNVTSFADSGTWRNMWIVTAATFAVMLILFVVFARLPRFNEESDDAPAAEMPKAKFSDGIKSPAVWLLGFCFLIVDFAITSLMSFNANYGMSIGLDIATANSYLVYVAIGMVVSGIVIGVLLNIFTEKRVVVLIVMMILTTIALVFVYRWQPGWAIPFMLFIGFVLSSVPTCCWSLIPDTALNPGATSVVFGVAAILENLGGALGGPITGAVIDTAGFNTACWELAGVALIATIVSFFYASAQKKLNARKIAQGISLEAH